MRLLCKIVSVATALVFFSPLFVSAADQEVQAVARMAKVGNLIITQQDVDRQTQKLMPMNASYHGGVSAEKIAAIKQQALDELVSRAYKVQYAINEELSVDGSAFESDWQNKLSKNPQAVDRVSAEQLNKIKADLYLDLLARKAESVAVDAHVVIADQDVAAYYAEHKEKYFRPKLYTASHVFVKVDPSDNREERKVKLGRAEELLKRAKAGEDFYNLAYYESDDRSKYVGGSLGTFHAGQMIAELDQAILTMQPGDIVGPVQTIYGYHIVKLDSLDEARQLQFDEVAAKIRSTMEEAERKQLYEKWMLQLKEKYPLERFDQ